MEKGNRYSPAHQPGDRNSYTERADNSLCHDEARLSKAVEESDSTEEDGRELAVDAVGLQVVGGRDDYLVVIGEDAAQQLPVEY